MATSTIKNTNMQYCMTSGDGSVTAPNASSIADYGTVPIKSNVTRGNFTVSNNAIVIGAGISAIFVWCKVYWISNSSNQICRTVIRRNGTQIARQIDSSSINYWHQSVVPSLAYVSEGDRIDIGVYSDNENAVVSSTNNDICLCVVAVPKA